MSRRTQQAMAYLEIVRRRTPDSDATWFDVAAAYDAGLRSAVENRRAAQRCLTMADQPGHSHVPPEHEFDENGKCLWCPAERHSETV